MNDKDVFLNLMNMFNDTHQKYAYYTIGGVFLYLTVAEANYIVDTIATTTKFIDLELVAKRITENNATDLVLLRDLIQTKAYLEKDLRILVYKTYEDMVKSEKTNEL
jgi:hypothetical protein